MLGSRTSSLPSPAARRSPSAGYRGGDAALAPAIDADDADTGTKGGVDVVVTPASMPAGAARQAVIDRFALSLHDHSYLSFFSSSAVGFSTSGVGRPGERSRDMAPALPRLRALTAAGVDLDAAPTLIPTSGGGLVLHGEGRLVLLREAERGFVVDDELPAREACRLPGLNGEIAVRDASSLGLVSVTSGQLARTASSGEELRHLASRCTPIGATARTLLLRDVSTGALHRVAITGHRITPIASSTAFPLAAGTTLRGCGRSGLVGWHGPMLRFFGSPSTTGGADGGWLRVADDGWEISDVALGPTGALFAAIHRPVDRDGEQPESAILRMRRSSGGLVVEARLAERRLLPRESWPQPKLPLIYWRTKLAVDRRGRVVALGENKLYAYASTIGGRALGSPVDAVTNPDRCAPLVLANGVVLLYSHVDRHVHAWALSDAGLEPLGPFGERVFLDWPSAVPYRGGLACRGRDGRIWVVD
jgi:hypothetical protein